MESNFPINIDIEKQPTDCTCGPTCLHAVYRYFESDVVLDSVIEGVRALEDGGTLGVFLGLNALSRNYSAQIYSYNLSTFDPSWGGLTSEELIQKLREQAKHKAAKKFQLKSKAYIEFLSRGGKLSFQQLSVELLQRYFSCGIPILTGLSATYLYGSKREYTDKNLNVIFDDVVGEPMGHFVVLCGWKDGKIAVADPYGSNPHKKRYYWIEATHLLHSILLGIVTYDANLLIISPHEVSIP